jgi:hypothetical protein
MDFEKAQALHDVLARLKPKGKSVGDKHLAASLRACV